MKSTESQADWQEAEVSAALREADAGDFATEAEVRAVFDLRTVAKLPKNGENPTTKAPPRRNV
jgi:predicted transcriptional regulator